MKKSVAVRHPTKTTPGFVGRPVESTSASTFIDERIKKLGDWRAKMLAKVCRIVHEGDKVPAKGRLGMKKALVELET
jgi:hypothetical protein